MTNKNKQGQLARQLFAIQDGRKPRDGQLESLSRELLELKSLAGLDKELEHWCQAWHDWIEAGAHRRTSS